MTEANNDPFDRWYAPPIGRETVKSLLKRNNGQGIKYFLAWVLLCSASGYLVYLSQGTAMLFPAMVLYGVFLGFSYPASHECAHGTAFKSRWLNESVFWITSLVFMEEPTYRRYSHSSHHTYTWFDGKDAQKPYGNPVSLWTYIRESSGLAMPIQALLTMGRIAFGKLNSQEREFTPKTEVRNLIFGARAMLSIYGGLVVSGIVFQTAAPFIYFFVPRFIGGWAMNLYINTQHMCMAENVEDHRYSSRTIKCNWLERLLYWNMNYHIEHHMFPTVPFHSLRALRQEIQQHLPVATNSVLSANRQILEAITRQKSYPAYSIAPVFRD